MENRLALLPANTLQPDAGVLPTCVVRLSPLGFSSSLAILVGACLRSAEPGCGGATAIHPLCYRLSEFVLRTPGRETSRRSCHATASRRRRSFPDERRGVAPVASADGRAHPCAPQRRALRGRVERAALRA